MTISQNRLLALRKEKDLNQETVASACGISRSTLSHYEKGLTPCVENAIALAGYFGVSVDYILGISDEKAPNTNAISESFVLLSKLAGEATPTTSDVLALAKAASLYMHAGKPCGLAPLTAWRDFMRHLTVCFASAAAGNGAQLIDAANAAVLAALEITKMPAAFIGKTDDT